MFWFASRGFTYFEATGEVQFRKAMKEAVLREGSIGHEGKNLRNPTCLPNCPINKETNHFFPGPRSLPFLT